MLRSAGESTIRSKKAGLQHISTWHHCRTALQTFGRPANLQLCSNATLHAMQKSQASRVPTAVIDNLQLLLAARRWVCDVELHCRPQGESAGVQAVHVPQGQQQPGQQPSQFRVLGASPDELNA